MYGCLMQEVYGKIRQEDSLIITSKLSTGWTTSWKRLNNYIY